MMSEHKFPRELVMACEAITNSETSRQIIIEVVDNGGCEDFWEVKEAVAPEMDVDEFYHDHLMPTHILTSNVNTGSLSNKTDVDIEIKRWGYHFLESLFDSLVLSTTNNE